MHGFFSPSSWQGNVSLQQIPQCGRCGLYKKCLSPKMRPTGKGKHSILFVGEAPGEQEDRQGVQLIGDAGQCLRRMLSVRLDDCWKTNAIICRPPKNKMDDLYIDCCRPNLVKTIADLKPKVIVLLGMSAVRAVIGQEWKRDLGALGRWVGWMIPSAKYKAWLCPTYHPSYVLRMGEDDVLVRFVKEHLEKAVALEDVSAVPVDLDEAKRNIEIITDPRDVRRRVDSIPQDNSIVAFDYEATGLKPERKEQRIWSVSFCVNGEDTFACRVDESCMDSLSAFLRGPTRKVASNLKFEERWTRVKLKHGVANWFWDTMLAAHLLDNRPGITSIKFLSYVYFGVPGYETDLEGNMEAKTANGLNRIQDIPIRDLLLYNGLDSLLEYKVMEKQIAALGY